MVPAGKETRASKETSVCVAILTRDAGDSFGALLDCVLASWPHDHLDVLVIDSGSRDTTCETARSRNVRLHEIPSDSFGHGRTRNLAVSLCHSDLIVFLSQDAMPDGTGWLHELVEAFLDERVAAAHSRLVARADATALEARSVAADLSHRPDARLQQVADAGSWRQLPVSERRVAAHFNNVASCLRRDLIAAYPFAECEFGEDLVWAEGMLLKGWALAYCPTSVVVHSHSSKLATDHRRHYSDAKLLRAMFDTRVSLVQALGSWVAEVARDTAWLASRLSTASPKLLIYSPLLRGVQAFGRWRGARVAESLVPRSIAPQALGAGGRRYKPQPLFEPDFYDAQLAPRPPKAVELLGHYVSKGDSQGRWPHPLFDPAHYAAQHAKLPERDGSRLLHFMNRGGDDCADPHPLFDVSWYASQPQVNLAADDNPLVHYLEVGDALDAWPNPSFDPTAYGSLHPEIEKRGGRRLVHFVATLERAGCETTESHPSQLLAQGMLSYAHQHENRASDAMHPGSFGQFCAQFFVSNEVASQALNLYPPGKSPHLEADALVELPIRFSRTNAPEVSIVIPAHGATRYTLACLRALTAADDSASFEVILVLDGPVEAAFDPFFEIQNLVVLRNPEARGFVHACNYGASRARASQIVFLNNDTLPCSGWLDALLSSRADFPNAGMVASRLLEPDGRLQECGSFVFSDGSAINYGKAEDPNAPHVSYAREVDYGSAAAVMIEADLFRRLEGFDELFAPAFYEDTDLAFRVRRAGRDVICQPASNVVHFGGINYRRDSETGRNPLMEVNRERFVERWASELALHEPAGASNQRASDRVVGGRLLVIDATTLTPLHDSGSLRMFNLLRVARRMGVRVTFAAVDLSHPPAEVARMRAAGIEVVVPPYLTSIDEFLGQRGAEFDVCIVSRPHTAERCLASVVKHCPQATLVYDTVDLHYLRREREVALHGQSSLSLREIDFEREACRVADCVWVVSEADRVRLLEVEPELNVAVQSNVHEDHASQSPYRSRSDILFIGGFRHAPNVDGVTWFVNEVLPLVREELPELVLRIVGSELPEVIDKLASDAVRIEGFVEDVAPLFESCLLSIAPLRYGAGVKGKVNQSMSYGLPCVATTIAAEGVEAVHEIDILIADDPVGFAQQIVRLHRDEALWSTVAEASLENIRTHFSMDAAERRWNELFAAVGLPSAAARVLGHTPKSG